MSRTFKFAILSPGGKAFEGDAESVKATGALGGFGVLAGHAPMIAAVVPGVCAVRTLDQGEKYFFAGEGVLEVSRSGVVMLVDEAFAVDNPIEARQRASERLRLEQRPSA
ncbi:MAG: F0F1 ATP synthase subunit epsilon [Kiritimatiellae bacterium]|nr:F0F1 ATP synthase subunit epsilon [Kiritimatiellia bacterium]MDW8459309.1 F0F1 ATP synthase subunit epsilon [Verrucomicrobiota bacterium]